MFGEEAGDDLDSQGMVQVVGDVVADDIASDVFAHGVSIVCVSEFCLAGEDRQGETGLEFVVQCFNLLYLRILSDRRD